MEDAYPPAEKVCTPLTIPDFSRAKRGPKGTSNPQLQGPGCQCSQCDQLHEPHVVGVPFARANRGCPAWIRMDLKRIRRRSKRLFPRFPLSESSLNTVEQLLPRATKSPPRFLHSVGWVGLEPTNNPLRDFPLCDLTPPRDDIFQSRWWKPPARTTEQLSLILLRKRGLDSCFLVEVSGLATALKALW